jgi:transposase
MAYKTLEFKLNPTPEQEATLNKWLLITRWVWNRGLGLIEEFRNNNLWDKTTKQSYPCTQIAYYSYMEKRLKPIEIQEWKKEIKLIETKKGIINPCYISPDIPPLTQLPTSKKNTPLVTLFGHNRHKDRVITYCVNGEEQSFQYTDCPFKFIQGTLITLSSAWIEFTKRPSEVKPPKFKNSKHPVKTLIHYNAEQLNFNLEQGCFTPHKSIGAIKIEGLKGRLDKDVKFNPLKICKKASGWYLQLTIEQEEKPIKYTGLSCGIDPGKLFIASLDNHFLLTPAKPLQESTAKLHRLQQLVSKKGHINNKDREKGDRYIKSKNWQKLQDEIAKLHETIARSRRSFNHWHTSNLTNWFDLLFVGDYTPKLAKAKKKEIKDESGNITGYAHNQQAQQKGRNKVSMDLAIGQFKDMLKMKSEEKGKCYYEVNEDYTSQVCPNCGHIHKKKLSKRNHECDVCGFTGNRDAVSAINIKLKGIAILLSLKDSDLEAIPNLIAVSNGNIRKFLEDQETKMIQIIRGCVDSKFNVWRLIVKLGIQQYLQRTTEGNSLVSVTPFELQGYLNKLQTYYNEKK